MKCARKMQRLGREWEYKWWVNKNIFQPSVFRPCSLSIARTGSIIISSHLPINTGIEITDDTDTNNNYPSVFSGMSCDLILVHLAIGHIVSPLVSSAPLFSHWTNSNAFDLDPWSLAVVLWGFVPMTVHRFLGAACQKCPLYSMFARHFVMLRVHVYMWLIYTVKYDI